MRFWTELTPGKTPLGDYHGACFTSDFKKTNNKSEGLLEWTLYINSAFKFVICITGKTKLGNHQIGKAEWHVTVNVR